MRYKPIHFKAAWSRKINCPTNIQEKDVCPTPQLPGPGTKIIYKGALSRIVCMQCTLTSFAWSGHRFSNPIQIIIIISLLHTSVHLTNCPLPQDPAFCCGCSHTNAYRPCLIISQCTYRAPSSFICMGEGENSSNCNVFERPKLATPICSDFDITHIML